MQDTDYLDSSYGIDLNVLHTGTMDCKPSHFYGPAVRDHFLIHFVLEGHGRFEINGNTYNIHKNQGFLICPNIISYYQADEADPWKYVWIGFNGLMARTYLKKANLSIESPIFTYDRDDSMIRFFEQLRSVGSMDASYETKQRGYAYLILSLLMESNPAQRSVKEDYSDLYIKKAVQYIHNNYSRNIHVNDISDHLGLNRSYFSTLFKDKLGQSPQRFIIKLKIERACKLMTNPSLSIGDISRSVGYSDPLCFSRIFKREKGISPTLFRQKL